MSEEKPESATSLEIAMLAAVIDPAACREGNSRDALFRAMALFQESAALCDEMAKKSYPEQTDSLLTEFGEGSKGARRLLDVMLRVSTAPVPMLTLAASDGEADTLRPYLETHCNLEGTSGRKSWSNIRTVLKNLRSWIVDLVNTDNTRNGAGIQARDIRDEEQARARGCSVEELNAGGWSGYQNERWQDAEQFFAEFLGRYAVYKNGRPAGHSIPREVIDNFIRWKRRIRTRKGGMSAVRPLTREEVFPKTSKKKI